MVAFVSTRKCFAFERFAEHFLVGTTANMTTKDQTVKDVCLLLDVEESSVRKTKIPHCLCLFRSFILRFRNLIPKPARSSEKTDLIVGDTFDRILLLASALSRTNPKEVKVVK